MTGELFNKDDYINHLIDLDNFVSFTEEAILGAEYSVEKYKMARSEFNSKFNEIFDITSDSYNRNITYEEHAIAKEHLAYLDSHFNKMVECIEIYKKIAIEVRSYLNNPANRKKDAFSILEKFGEIKANIPAIPVMSNDLREKIAQFDPRLNDILLKLNSEAINYRRNFLYLNQVASNLNATIYNYDKYGEYKGSSYLNHQEIFSKNIVESKNRVDLLKQSIDVGKLSGYELEQAQKEIYNREENIEKITDFSNRISEIISSVEAEEKNKNNDRMLDFINISNYENFDNLSITIAGFKVFESTIIQKIADNYNIGNMPPAITVN